jgi:hypothetical protein
MEESHLAEPHDLEETDISGDVEPNSVKKATVKDTDAKKTTTVVKVAAKDTDAKKTTTVVKVAAKDTDAKKTTVKVVAKNTAKATVKVAAKDTAKAVDVKAADTKTVAAKATAKAVDVKAADTKKVAAKRAPTKRGPGRPPIAPPAPRSVRKGIVTEPTNPDYKFELVWSAPLSIKTLNNMLRNIKAKEIIVHCGKTALTVFAVDHGLISRNLSILDGKGKETISYFCGTEYWFKFTQSSTDKMFSSITRGTHEFSLVLSKSAGNKVTFVLANKNLNNEQYYDFPITFLENNVGAVVEARSKIERVFKSIAAFDQNRSDESSADEKGIYSVENNSESIELTLSSQDFKQIVGDIANYSNSFSFEKQADSPLRLEYTKEERAYSNVFKDPAKIKLICRMTSPVFRCEANAAKIKSFASNMVAKSVRIICCQNDDVIFCNSLDDDALVVYVIISAAVASQHAVLGSD